MKEDMAVLNIRIGRKELKEFGDLAKRNGLTKSELARLALTNVEVVTPHPIIKSKAILRAPLDRALFE